MEEQRRKGRFLSSLVHFTLKKQHRKELYFIHTHIYIVYIGSGWLYTLEFYDLVEL